MHAGFFTCADPVSFVPTQIHTLEMTEKRLALLQHGMQSLGADFVAGALLSPGVVNAARVDGWDQISVVRDGSLAAEGLVDAVNVVAVEPDGSGCVLANFRTPGTTLRSPENWLLRRVFRHFLAAHRLRRNQRRTSAPPDSADAIFDSNGRIHHASGAAVDPGLRAALRVAVTESESARGRRRKSDPYGALDAWECLVAGRWTLATTGPSRRFSLVN